MEPFKKNKQTKLMKGYLSNTKCPKNKKKSPYFCAKNKITIKILGVAFVMCIYVEPFYQSWIDQANKRLFEPYRAPKKIKLAFFVQKFIYINIVS